jgi:hypothetical protein
LGTAPAASAPITASAIASAFDFTMVETVFRTSAELVSFVSCFEFFSFALFCVSVFVSVPLVAFFLVIA